MLSAGERPQPPHTPVVDSTVSKARIMPDLTNGTNGVTSSTPKPAEMQHIWIVTGPAGCGKSTVGNVLRTELAIPFLEGDDVSTKYLNTDILHHTHPTHPVAPKTTPKAPPPNCIHITNQNPSTTPRQTKTKWATAHHSQTKTAGTGSSLCAEQQSTSSPPQKPTISTHPPAW